MSYASIRQVYAAGFGAFMWAVALAGVTTFYGLDPAAPVVRGGAVVVGLIFWWHVKRLAELEISDSPSAVGFPLKMTLALFYAGLFAWVTVRAAAIGVALSIFGGELVVPPAVEFTGVALLCWFGLPGAELQVFRRDLTQKPRWLARLVGLLRLVAQPNREASERLDQMFQDRARHVTRWHDDDPITGPAEARRRAEEEL